MSLTKFCTLTADSVVYTSLPRNAANTRRRGWRTMSQVYVVIIAVDGPRPIRLSQYGRNL
jgi:hypothetical protein